LSSGNSYEYSPGGKNKRPELPAMLSRFTFISCREVTR
jgi:hypothetical protein